MAAVAMTVAACGTTPEERGISGGGIGVASGALVGAITGLTILEGALIGAGLGVAAGVLTDAEDFNLGEPIWKSWPQFASAATETDAASASLVASVQSGLTKLGYDPGQVDGVLNPKTGAAIREYQFDHDLPVDGKPTEQLELHVLAQSR